MPARAEIRRRLDRLGDIGRSGNSPSQWLNVEGGGNRSNSQAGMDWWSQEDRISRLRHYWEETELTAKEIGDILKCTKHAVIGKANRCGFKPRFVYAEKPPPHRPLLLIANDECTFPTGHPGEKGFHFCGKPAEHGKSYCADHLKITTAKPPKNEKPPGRGNSSAVLTLWGQGGAADTGLAKEAPR